MFDLQIKWNVNVCKLKELLLHYYKSYGQKIIGDLSKMSFCLLCAKKIFFLKFNLEVSANGESCIELTIIGANAENWKSAIDEFFWNSI